MRIRWLTPLVLAMVLALVAAACGGANPTATPQKATQAPPSTAQATPTPRPTQAPAPTPTVPPTSTGEITVALVELHGFVMNPAASPVGGYRVAHMETLFDYTMSTKPEGAFDKASGFVQSYSANADSTIWTLKVRDDTSFHNGDRASATDLEYTIGLGLAGNAPFNSAGDLKNVSKLASADAATLVATLKAPDIFWPVSQVSRNRSNPNSPFFLLSKKCSETAGSDVANKNPVGTGPYKFKSVTVGDRIVVEAVDKHFFYGVPKTKMLSFMAVPEENTRIALLKSGAADAAPIAQSNINPLKQAGLRIVLRENSQVAFQWSAQYPDVIQGYGPNPLTNLKVRQALFWYGVDRKAMVASFLNGFGTPSMDYPVTIDDAAYKPQAVPAYDPALAKSLLAEAGYAKGFELDYYMAQVGSAALPNSPEISEAVAVWWEQLGIKVHRIPYTGQVLSNLWLANYKTGGWTKPTVGSIGGGGYFREVNSPFALLMHNPDSFASVDRDPEGLRLANAFLNAKTVEEYVRNGIAYQEYNHKQVAGWMPYFLTGEAWAASTKASAGWKLGKDPGYRTADVAALR